MQAVRELGPRMPLFGVCMGHQCIGEVFGGQVVRAPSGVMHGKVSAVTHTNVGLLKVRPVLPWSQFSKKVCSPSHERSYTVAQSRVVPAGRDEDVCTKQCSALP